MLNLADEVIRHKVIALPAKGRHAKRAEARGERPRSIDPDTELRSFPRPRVSHTRGGCDTDKVVT